MKKTFFAFTLAEVLITLGIIGIIASLTIPTLMNDIQDKQFKTAWKKEYSIVNQAYMQYLSDNSMNLSFGTWTSTTDMKTALKSYFSYIKECETGQILDKCWNSFGAYNKTSKQIYPATSGWWDVSGTNGNNGLVLKDGSALLFMTDGTYSCTGPSNNYGECARVIVDINGPKNPNTWGRDIFMMYLYPNKILPCGSPLIYNTSASNDCDTGSGSNCGYKYLVGD